MSTTTSTTATPSDCICTHMDIVHAGTEMACIGTDCTCRSYYPAKLATRSRWSRWVKKLPQYVWGTLFAITALTWVAATVAVFCVAWRALLDLAA